MYLFFVRYHNLAIFSIALTNHMASKVFWSQKTAGGDSDESPPFA